MKKVLYAENDINLAMAVKSLLQTMEMEVLHVTRGRDVLAEFAAYNPDLLILDVMLDDDKDGFQVAEEIRKKSKVPVLFVSTCEDIKQLRRAFNIKFTDYICKPFVIQDLQLRIDRILHQGEAVQTSENHFVLGRARFIPAKQLLIIHEREMHLSSSESAVLEFLCQHINEYVKKEQLTELISSGGYFKTGVVSIPNILSRLRSILKQERKVIIKRFITGKVKLVYVP
jgi:DNA-binding response OmpR family regulator